MIRGIILILTLIAAPLAVAGLQCYQCFGCESATTIECNDQAVAALNQATDSVFHQISTEKSEKFDCITLAFLANDYHSKMQGCVYNSQYACSIKPRNYSVVFICGTCDSDFCNSSTSVTNGKIIFTMFATMFSVIIARIL